MLQLKAYTKTKAVNNAKNKYSFIPEFYDVLTFGKHDAFCPKIIQEEARKGKTTTTQIETTKTQETQPAGDRGAGEPGQPASAVTAQTSLMGWITVWSLPFMVFRLFE
ncbi:hypothetical protein CSKR_203181 [Clonorchis sinensis]|uniref:Uncharacterized protein n=1 Tax=Clonorchis sinensis TaxID=79923 RepID=A0A8T1M897_CLOSI|nr:hypothetical protein CSKR_203181 [Clonorchis sinensis]